MEAGRGQDGGTSLLDQLGGLSDPVTILDLELGEGAVAETGGVVSVGYIGTRIDPETGEEIIFDQNLKSRCTIFFHTRFRYGDTRV